jgi:hypothetical protein
MQRTSLYSFYESTAEVTWEPRVFSIGLLYHMVYYAHATVCSELDPLLLFHLVSSPSWIPHNVYHWTPAAESCVKAVISHWRVVVVLLRQSVVYISLQWLAVLVSLLVQMTYFWSYFITDCSSNLVYHEMTKSCCLQYYWQVQSNYYYCRSITVW